MCQHFDTTLHHVLLSTRVRNDLENKVDLFQLKREWAAASNVQHKIGYMFYFFSELTIKLSSNYYVNLYLKNIAKWCAADKFNDVLEFLNHQIAPFNTQFRFTADCFFMVNIQGNSKVLNKSLCVINPLFEVFFSTNHYLLLYVFSQYPDRDLCSLLLGFRHENTLDLIRGLKAPLGEIRIYKYPDFFEVNFTCKNLTSLDKLLKYLLEFCAYLFKFRTENPTAKIQNFCTTNERFRLQSRYCSNILLSD